MEINKKYLKYLLCLVPFMLSTIVYTQIYGSFANTLLALKMLAFLYIVKEYIEDNNFTKLDATLGVYFFIWFISTLINNGSKIGYVKEVVVILSYVLLIENAFNKKEDDHLVRAFEHIVFSLLLVNLMCLIIYPEGIWKTYSIYGNEAVYSFLGLYNQVTPLLIIAEMILLIRIYYDHYKVSLFTFIYSAILVGNSCLMMSATGIIGCVLVPLVTLLGFKYRSHINIKTVSIVVVTVFLLIVVFRKQAIFAFIIEGVFDKDLNLTDRVDIWDRAIAMIREKPWLGYGCGTMDKIIVDRSAHDYYLQILLQAGLLGFVAYINIFYVALKKSWINRKQGYSIIIAASLCGYMICCISEVYMQAWLLIMLTFAYNYMPDLKKSDNDMTKTNQYLS